MEILLRRADAPCGGCNSDDSEMRCGRCKYALYCSKECQRDAWPSHKLHCAPSAAAPSETTCVVWQHPALCVGDDPCSSPILEIKDGEEATNCLFVNADIEEGTLLLIEHCIWGDDPDELSSYAENDMALRRAVARFDGPLFSQICWALVPDETGGGVALGRVASHVGFRARAVNAVMPTFWIDDARDDVHNNHPIMSRCFVVLYADVPMRAGDAVVLAHAPAVAARAPGATGPLRCQCGAEFRGHASENDARVRSRARVMAGHASVIAHLKTYTESERATRTLVAQALTQAKTPRVRALAETIAARTVAAWRERLARDTGVHPADL